MKRAFFLVSLVLPTSPVSAGNESRYQAVNLPGQQFEVIGRYSENSIYWCGAGHFAATQLGRSTDTLVYVVKGRSASRTSPGKTAVTFGFTPTGPAVRAPGYAIDPVPGMALSITQARGYCTDRSASDG